MAAAASTFDPVSEWESASAEVSASTLDPASMPEPVSAALSASALEPASAPELGAEIPSTVDASEGIPTLESDDAAESKLWLDPPSCSASPSEADPHPSGAIAPTSTKSLGSQ
jgi:hypothetical protein